MKRITRQRRLTPAEAQKYNLIRQQVVGELSELARRHARQVGLKLTPKPILLKDYKTGDLTGHGGDTGNSPKASAWQIEDIKRYCGPRKQPFSLTSNLQPQLLELYGKQSFMFQGSEFRFRVWGFDFEGETFVVLSNSRKGTCIECTVPLIDLWNRVAAKEDLIVRFLEALKADIYSLYCLTCGKRLNQPCDPASTDCGGDCVACMADAGDPDCIKTMEKIQKQS